MIDLSKIVSPSDIRQLNLEECAELADDIRTKIIQTVAQTGGHLSSNLGVVEITMALHRVFQTPVDKLVFDVGHQTYPHKLLTGRYQQFDTLRAFGGLSGFPKCSESEYDCFETGHASTALSAALGMARARDVRKEDHHVVAVVGDGALTGGMCYEALNDCGNDKTRMIILLNDNEMSIARNVGGLSQHLSQLRASKRWRNTKDRVKMGLNRLPGIGKTIESVASGIKKSIKSILVDEGFFSALGLHYIGPIDGHNLETLEKILEQAKQYREPVLIHCITKKGYGYNRAERKPEAFHGTTPFFIESGKSSKANQASYGRVAVDAVCQLAQEDASVAVVTAAMELGTSTEHFHHAFPERFFDVGIAEEHAVTLCAGMARDGLRPFFFVYSTFLQRGYDQVLHDVCLQKLPVVFLLDRSGLSNEDGETHQGLYDFAYLRHIPNMTLLAPADDMELVAMIRAAHSLSSPCAIRYPKNAVTLAEGYSSGPFSIGTWQCMRQGKDGAILAVGTMVETALQVAEALSTQQGIDLEVINASTIKPLDGTCLQRLQQKNKPIFTLEEHAVAGGFGAGVLEYLAIHGLQAMVHPIGVGDFFPPHGDHQSLLTFVGLSPEAVQQTIQYHLKAWEEAHG